MASPAQFTTTLPDGVAVLETAERLSIRATGSDCDGNSYYAVSEESVEDGCKPHRRLFDIVVSKREDSAFIMQADRRSLVFQCKNGLLDNKQMMTISLPTGEAFAEVDIAIIRCGTSTTRISAMSSLRNPPLTVKFRVLETFKPIFSSRMLGGGGAFANIRDHPSNKPSLHDKSLMVIVLFKLYYSFYKMQRYHRPWIIPESMSIAPAPTFSLDQLQTIKRFHLINAGAIGNKTMYTDILSADTGIVALVVQLSVLTPDKILWRDQYGRVIFVQLRVFRDLWNVLSSAGVLIGQFNLYKLFNTTCSTIMSVKTEVQQNGNERFQYEDTTSQDGRPSYSSAQFYKDEASASCYLEFNLPIDIVKTVLIICNAQFIASKRYNILKWCIPRFPVYPFRRQN